MCSVLCNGTHAYALFMPAFILLLFLTQVRPQQGDQRPLCRATPLQHPLWPPVLPILHLQPALWPGRGVCGPCVCVCRLCVHISMHLGRGVCVCVSVSLLHVSLPLTPSHFITHYTLCIALRTPLTHHTALPTTQKNQGYVFGYDAIGSFERVPYCVTGSSSSLITSLFDNQVAFKHQKQNKKDLSQEEGRG
jgi:hypothetical protein